MPDPETIELNGHNVPAERVDQFLSGRTGQPIPDDQWDESKRRVAIAEELDALAEGDAPVLVTWEPVPEEAGNE